MAKSWDIIYWIGENSTDFIPSCWSNKSKTKYRFPVGPRMSETKKRALIYTCSSLEDGEYVWYDARCKKEGIDNLEKAKSLCKMSTVTSNLESEDEEPGSDDEEFIEETRSKKTAHPQTTNKFPIKINLPISSLSEMVSTERSWSPVSAVLHVSIESGTSLSSSVASTSKSVQSIAGPSTSAERAGQQFTLEELHKKVDALETMLRLIIEKLDPTAEGGIGTNHQLRNTIIMELPCASVENDFDKSLDSKIKRKTLEEILFLTGGDNSHKAVYNIMKKLLTPEVVLKYSALGKKEKLSFSQLKIYSVLVDAVRRRFSTTSDVDIRKSVSSFLATGKDRIKKNTAA